MRKSLFSIISPAVLAVSLAITPAAFTSAKELAPGTLEEKGSWAKGLIAVTAEEEKGGEGWEYRKRQLLRYYASINVNNESSLREFRDNEDEASRAIGLDKTGMIFHLLKRTAGEETFSRIARMLLAESTTRSWDDIRSLFEQETGRDLGWFFRQWVDRKGLPALHAEKAEVKRNGSRFEVSFDLVQTGDAYTLDVPVFISYLRGGGKTEVVTLDGERKRIALFVDEEPGKIVIDGDYDLPRRLTAAETPPLLAKLAGDAQILLIAPASAAERYAAADDAWKQRGAGERMHSNVTESDITTSSLLVFGSDNPLIAGLFGGFESSDDDLSLVARKNPRNDEKVVVIVQAKTDKAAAEAFRLITREGACSTLSIDAQGRERRETKTSARGIVMELRTEAAAIDVSAIKTLSDVIEKASAGRIVYVGEYHDRFAHHDVQLQVIKSLFRKDPKLAIGMEMFQRPFQKALDDYIGGIIDEREFLKKSEYFSRWSYDYNLYKPILDFARAEKIPVVALNLRREIVEKVSKSGLDALTGDEKKELPSRMDFSDAEYRDRLKQVFEQHKGHGKRSFDFFYQSQILWDETMAHSIDEYLQTHNDRRMVVIAGLGHLIYGSGIPKRVHRRNAFTFSTILNDADVEPNAADYLVFPQPLEGVQAPKLMVVLKETAGRISIADLPKGSLSKKAGVKTGDIIVALDGAPVRSVDDIKIALFYKKQSDAVKVRVVRKRLLLGETELEFDVKLP